MRFSVHLCQRKFLNITSSFFHSCFTWFVHPVTSFCQFRRSVSCICHTRIFPVQLLMSPVHVFCVFVHQIYAWNQIHVWIQICSEWNETTLDGSRCLALMYVQELGWSYVITPGMQRHTRDLRISAQITVPRPESHDSWSDPPNPECHPTPPSRTPAKPQTWLDRSVSDLQKNHNEKRQGTDRRWYDASYGSGEQLGLPGNLISSSI
jgi:hypothetical protein